jgi:hypothetical protein
MLGRNNGPDTLFFVDRKEVPEDRWKDVTYGKIVCNVQPLKAEAGCTRLTFGGNNAKTTIDCRTLTADLLTAKLLFKSIISAIGAKFPGLDLKTSISTPTCTG